MKNHRTAAQAAFRPGLRTGLLLSFVGLSSLALLTVASEPASHAVAVPTVAGQTTEVTWTGTIPAGFTAGVGADCSAPQATMRDTHAVMLTVPAGVYDNVNVSATFKIEWEDSTQDEALAVTLGDETLGTSDGGTATESVTVNNPAAGTYTAIACPYTAVIGTEYTGTLTLTALSKDAAASSPEAGPGNGKGLPPRFQLYAPDYAKDGFGMFGGEATLDVNWKTGSIFYIGFLETLRLKLNHATSPATEEWVKTQTIASNKVTSDPILVGDRDTGRIFAMQLLVGAGTSAMDYTDDDGESYTPGMAGSVLRSGADHQGMDVGPYPPGTSIPHPLYPNAVYYCSQDIALAYCSRSDDGGVTFGPSTQVYTQGNCNGLHGHPKVAANGVVYLPNSKCTPLGSGAGILANRPAVIVSENAGLTWAVRFIGTAVSGGGSDPSLASASDGTVYFSYTDANFNLHMAKSSDKGVTWTDDVNIGALVGITKATFPAVVAGDPDRAAVAFFGSTLADDSNPEDDAGFAGIWHLYVATTYDGGKTYHVVNLTPNDPIQRGPICGGNYCRNLLDFFDAVIDPDGKVLVAYEDGCVGGCITGGVSQFSDQAVIARQSGGRSLFAAKDVAEPKLPGAPRLEGYRTPNFAFLEWPATDSGGGTLSGYKVYRGTSATNLALYGVAGTSGKFVDTQKQAGVTYFYQVAAVNSLGEGPKGNVLMLAEGTNAPALADVCTLPGMKVATDATGEAEALAPAFRDIEEMYIAEPEDMPGKVVVSLKMTDAAPQQGGGSDFYLWFDSSKQKDRTWRGRVGPDAMPLQFWDGHVIPTDDTLDSQREYTAAGTLETGSGFFAGGFVRFVLDKAKLNLVTGDKLLSVNGRSLPFTRLNNILTEEAGYFDYTLLGNDFCAKGGVVPTPVIETSSSGGSSSGGSSSSSGGSSSGAVSSSSGGPSPITPAAPGDTTSTQTTGRNSGRFGGGAFGLALLPLLLLVRRRRVV